MKNSIETSNFIEDFVLEDREKLNLKKIVTRFPPEPNGFLHIGHVKALSISFTIAEKFGGITNLRMDDTNPIGETQEFVDNMKKDISWLGFKWKNFRYASSYYGRFYKDAIKLIKKGLAFVCDLTAEEIRVARGTLTTSGENSPYRNRSIEENLELFKGMKNGFYDDGFRVLRAKIDMASPNMNLRDPVMYRIAREYHFRTKNKWLIYPMYDYAHPLSDAYEGITHSLCDLDFEDHRPLYDWFLINANFIGKNKPRQIEFSKLKIEGAIIGKRYIRKLIENNLVDGFSDPRLLTIKGMRRRGYTPESLKDFVIRVGVTKADSQTEFQYLEYCVREDLNKSATRVMAVLDPIKVIITNYPEGRIENIETMNNPNNKKEGSHETIFGREIYIEREDFSISPPKGYKRLVEGGFVRLRGAYIIKCDKVNYNEDGSVLSIEATYNEQSKSGNDQSGIKVAGVIHWVNANDCTSITVANLDQVITAGKEFTKDNLLEIFNHDSYTLNTLAVAENYILKVDANKQMQFMRNGYYILDSENQTERVYINIVNLKDGFRPEKARKQL